MQFLDPLQRQNGSLLVMTVGSAHRHSQRADAGLGDELRGILHLGVILGNALGGLADFAQLTLDASGTALNRRGYRTWNGEAPLRETLAAALVSLSPWRPGMPLHDPMCGTGTLMIEAAMRMAHRAPGLTREFALESWRSMPVEAFRDIREQARAEFDPARVEGISGAGRVRFEVADMRDCRRAEPQGAFLCNPPYGERLSDRRACETLYRDMGQMLRANPGWSLSAITSHPGFERCFGRRADKKRRFYNGRLECEFMTFGLPKSKR